MRTSRQTVAKLLLAWIAVYGIFLGWWVGMTALLEDGQLAGGALVAYALPAAVTLAAVVKYRQSRRSR
ncbi:MAG: hypothetical protein ACE5JP_09170 [Candidatus Bipolaricaulia bacterium]